MCLRFPLPHCKTKSRVNLRKQQETALNGQSEQLHLIFQTHETDHGLVHSCRQDGRIFALLTLYFELLKTENWALFFPWLGLGSTHAGVLYLHDDLRVKPLPVESRLAGFFKLHHVHTFLQEYRHVDFFQLGVLQRKRKNACTGNCNISEIKFSASSNRESHHACSRSLFFCSFWKLFWCKATNWIWTASDCCPWTKSTDERDVPAADLKSRRGPDWSVPKSCLRLGEGQSVLLSHQPSQSSRTLSKIHAIPKSCFWTWLHGLGWQHRISFNKKQTGGSAVGNKTKTTQNESN